MADEQKTVFKAGVNTFRLNRNETEMLNGVMDTLDSNNLQIREAVILLGQEALSGTRIIEKPVITPDPQQATRIQQLENDLKQARQEVSEYESINSQTGKDSAELGELKKRYDIYVYFTQKATGGKINTLDQFIDALLSGYQKNGSFILTKADQEEYQKHKEALING